MTTFETMLELLKSNLAEETPAPNLEATALLTDQNHVYVAVCRDFGSDCGYDNMLAMLKTRGETRIMKMVTMMKNGFINISPFLWKSIYEMNEENLETEVLVLSRKRDDPEETPSQPTVRMLKDFPYVP